MLIGLILKSKNKVRCININKVKKTLISLKMLKKTY